MGQTPPPQVVGVGFSPGPVATQLGPGPETESGTKIHHPLHV